VSYPEQVVDPAVMMDRATIAAATALRSARNYRGQPQDQALAILDASERSLQEARRMVRPYVDAELPAYQGEFVPGASREAGERAISVSAQIALNSGRIALARQIATGDLRPYGEVSNVTMGHLFGLGQAYRLARTGKDQTVTAAVIVVSRAAEIAAGRPEMTKAWRLWAALTVARTIVRDREHFGTVRAMLRGGRRHYKSRAAAHKFSAALELVS
jgi:hypothetical protein